MFLLLCWILKIFEGFKKKISFATCSLAGVSRSVTVVVAYVMTVTELGWRDSLNAVRGARNCASPNFGFQRQLLEFQHENLMQVTVLLESLGIILQDGAKKTD